MRENGKQLINEAIVLAIAGILFREEVTFSVIAYVHFTVNDFSLVDDVILI